MPKRRKPEDKANSKNATVVRVLCGWCATSDHVRCKRELLWYEKHYICSCSCADEFYNKMIKTEKGA